jgi:enediyne biosynthesis protein E5
MSPVWRIEPRYYQMATLTGLLLYGISELDFPVTWQSAGLIISTALLSQYVATRLFKLPVFDPRSALIASLSLCILMRADSQWLLIVGAMVTIFSKFILRWQSKHIFNPTNLGLTSMMYLTGGQMWVSPGQWGNLAFFSFLIACLGMVVVYRALRNDVTFAFLGFYVSILLGRAMWLGDPWAIPLHQLQNGALLLFAFFMISDPKTTPDSRAGRILFALCVALGAALVQFVFYRTNGLLWSLVCCSLLVPLLDWWLPGKRYQWSNPTVQ